MNSRLRWRWVLAGAAAILIAIAGISIYGRMTPAPVAARGDPAVLVATALAALERSDDPLTDEQRDAVLPLLRVLRDVDPAEVEPSRALAQAIMDALSSDQRAEIERLREEARARPGAPGGQARAAVRQRLLGRLVERLETHD